MYTNVPTTKTAAANTASPLHPFHSNYILLDRKWLLEDATFQNEKDANDCR
jgi:hypothetical protein